jgi:hypothetical protein
MNGGLKACNDGRGEKRKKLQEESAGQASIGTREDLGEFFRLQVGFSEFSELLRHWLPGLIADPSVLFMPLDSFWLRRVLISV